MPLYPEGAIPRCAWASSFRMEIPLTEFSKLGKREKEIAALLLQGNGIFVSLRFTVFRQEDKLVDVGSE
jgi:hypothetical protein